MNRDRPRGDLRGITFEGMEFEPILPMVAPVSDEREVHREECGKHNIYRPARVRWEEPKGGGVVRHYTEDEKFEYLLARVGLTDAWKALSWHAKLRTFNLYRAYKSVPRTFSMEDLSAFYNHSSDRAVCMARMSNIGLVDREVVDRKAIYTLKVGTDEEVVAALVNGWEKTASRRYDRSMEKKQKRSRSVEPVVVQPELVVETVTEEEPVLVPDAEEPVYMTPTEEWLCETLAARIDSLIGVFPHIDRLGALKMIMDQIELTDIV